MKKKGLLTGLLVLSIAICAAAITDLTGKWSGDIKLPSMSVPVTYNFKVDGEKLTGTLTGPDGTSDIDSGVIKGNSFRFVISGKGNNPVASTGTYFGDSTTVDVALPYHKLHIKLTKAK